MIIKEAINLFSDHQKDTLKPRSIDSYNYILKRLEASFAERGAIIKSSV